MRLGWVVGAMVGALAAGGCEEPAAQTASVTIVVPQEGATVCGAPLLVELDVRGLDLVDPATPPEEAVAGTGHADVLLNGQDVYMTDSPTFDLEDVADGEYQLKVELSNADHSPVVPYAGALVYITVDGTVCEGS